MPTPKSKLYVSLSNNGIYPAMGGGAEGYEDEHLSEWRPANADEVEKYNRGELSVTVRPIEMLASAPAAPAQPQSIQLAEDDAPTIVSPPTTVVEAPVVQPAPVQAQPSPVMPAPVAPAPVQVIEPTAPVAPVPPPIS